MIAWRRKGQSHGWTRTYHLLRGDGYTLCARPIPPDIETKEAPYKIVQASSNMHACTKCEHNLRGRHRVVKSLCDTENGAK